VRGGTFDDHFPALYPPLTRRSPSLKALLDFGSLGAKEFSGFAYELPRLRASLLAGERCEQALRHLHTVDITFTEEYHLLRGANLGIWNYLKTIEPYVKVVRYFSLWGSTAKWARFARRVYFVPLLLRSSAYSLLCKDWYVPWDGCGEEVVIHLTGAQPAPLQMRWSNRTSFSAGSITLIFTDLAVPNTSEDRGTSKRRVAKDKHDRAALDATVRLLLTRGKASVTLVDAAPALFGANCPDEVIPLLHEAARSLAPRLFPSLGPSIEADVPTIPDRVTMLTRDEYRHRVGEEMYALDMVGIDVSRRRKSVRQESRRYYLDNDSDSDHDYNSS
jgi:hypothetical protein